MTSLDGKAQETISARLLEHEKLVHKVMGSKRLLKAVEEAAGMISLTLASGGKVMFCGNGGSAADAQHWAAEIVGRFQKERPGMAALALTTDTSILTAIGNDYGYDTIFSRQVEGALAEVDGGLVEAGESMGLAPLDIIWRIYLKEGLAALARGTTLTAISLISLTTMAGAVGAGGLGDFAIRYGHDRNQVDVTWVTIVVLVAMVTLIQVVGNRIVKKNTH